MELNKNNYFSVDANMEYMGATQFKDFMKCESEGLAKANGTVVEEPSKAMLVGSYVDAYFSGELDEFKANNPQILKKDGTLLKDFEQANDIIKKGVIEPTHCGKCPVCRKAHKVQGVISYRQLFNKGGNENEESEQ